MFITGENSDAPFTAYDLTNAIRHVTGGVSLRHELSPYS